MRRWKLSDSSHGASEKSSSCISGTTSEDPVDDTSPSAENELSEPEQPGSLLTCGLTDEKGLGVAVAVVVATVA